MTQGRKRVQWGALYSAGCRYSAGEIAWHSWHIQSGNTYHSARARHGEGESAKHVPALLRAPHCCRWGWGNERRKFCSLRGAGRSRCLLTEKTLVNITGKIRRGTKKQTSRNEEVHENIRQERDSKQKGAGGGGTRSRESCDWLISCGGGGALEKGAGRKRRAGVVVVDNECLDHPFWSVHALVAEGRSA